VLVPLHEQMPRMGVLCSVASVLYADDDAAL
jgi:hypothetical protein